MVGGGAVLCCVVVCDPGPMLAQGAPVVIEVHAQVSQGELRPVWSCFGYDEPNYTCAENGKKLLGELRQLSPAPVYVRVHNLLRRGLARQVANVPNHKKIEKRADEGDEHHRYADAVLMETHSGGVNARCRGERAPDLWLRELR
jgi:hypothetical protein